MFSSRPSMFVSTTANKKKEQDADQKPQHQRQSHHHRNHHPRNTKLVRQKSIMRMTRTWDIKLPPCISSNPNSPHRLITGTFSHAVQPVTSKLNTGNVINKMLQRQKRRLCIEIHGPADTDEQYDHKSGGFGCSGTTKSRMKTTTTRTNTDDYDGEVEKQEEYPTVARRSGTSMRRSILPSKQRWNTASRNVVNVSQQHEQQGGLQDDDRIVVRILKPRRGWGFGSKDPHDSSSSSSDDDDDSDGEDSEDDDEKSIDSILSSIADSDSEGNHPQSLKDFDDGWIEYRKWGIDEIRDDHLKNESNPTTCQTWVATFGVESLKERREIIFSSPQQAQEFVSEIAKLRELVKDRAAIRLEKYQELQGVEDTDEITPRSTDSGALIRSPSQLNATMTATTNIDLLIEIVSATDLPISDWATRSIDAYVVVYLGNQKIHKTGYIPKNLNPVWTVDTGSLFILSLTAEEFFTAGYGLTFVIKDFDSMGANDVICRKTVASTDLLKEQHYGQRVAIELRMLHGVKGSSQHFSPKLYLRVKRATTYDKVFMKQVMKLQKSKKAKRRLIDEAGVYANTAFVAPRPDDKGYNPLRREHKLIDGIKKYRVKPRPDPDRPENETSWLTSKQLNEEMMKPTSRWLEAGSGSIGKAYLEVLECKGLPNMDAGGGLGVIQGYTDAFCCIIYEDAIVNTDVINDELSPKWMPWCNRGFVFNIGHASSQILLGVFDYDGEMKGLNEHDPIGRISIEITNFRADTEYVLSYDLHSSVLDDVRKSKGTITVRLRLEYNNGYRAFVKGSLRYPELNYINLAKKNDFNTAFFVCNGEENLQRLDVGAIMAYKNELLGYIDIFHYIGQSLNTVLLWRGHYEIGDGVMLPLHSAAAFLMGIYVVEDFSLLPPCGLFCVAWLLLATNEFKQRHPSPWRQTLTYAEMWRALLTNTAPPERIEPHENEDRIRHVDEIDRRRKSDEMQKAEEAADQAKKLGAFLVVESSGADEQVKTDLSTNKGGGGFTAFASKAIPIPNIAAMVLLPFQRNLGMVCKFLRVLSSFVMWDESIYAFAIVNVCIAGGIGALFVPWAFLFRWKLRIMAWGLLGPWMKLVDVFYVRPSLNGAENESEAFKKMAETKIEQLALAREAVMLQKEKLLKIRAMKMYMFGKHITRVPQWKEYRFSDTPRMESSATPLSSRPRVDVHKRSHGQKIVGDMIPTWGDAVEEDNNSTEKQQIKSDAGSTPRQTDRLLRELSFELDKPLKSKWNAAKKDQ